MPEPLVAESQPFDSVWRPPLRMYELPPSRPVRIDKREKAWRMYQRPKPAAPARAPAGAVVTAAEFADLPFGGHAGEWLSVGRPDDVDDLER